LKLLDTIASKIDKTVKYIFQLDDQLIMEIAYIDNDTGKDIICVSTQTACLMGCKFCHTTDYRTVLKTRNLTEYEILKGIEDVARSHNLFGNKRMLLISYMGCGEPLLNSTNVVDSMHHLMYHSVFKSIRFAIATMIPKNEWTEFANLTNCIKKYRLPVKIHLSLHFSTDEIRQVWIPSALNLKPSLDLLMFYKHLTGNNVEVHYTPIKDVNNGDQNMRDLGILLFRTGIPIKFLKFNEKKTLNAHEGTIDTSYLDDLGIKYEFYTPPGLDIGASCGQFLFDYYLNYNKKAEQLLDIKTSEEWQ